MVCHRFILHGGLFSKFFNYLVEFIKNYKISRESLDDYTIEINREDSCSLETAENRKYVVVTMTNDDSSDKDYTRCSFTINSKDETNRSIKLYKIVFVYMFVLY